MTDNVTINKVLGISKQLDIEELKLLIELFKMRVKSLRYDGD